MTEFEFDSTPETDAMLKQLCIKECFVRCKDCKYYNPTDHCYLQGAGENDYCSYGERAEA